MTNYHAWKRRLWGPEYPVENGPPYLDPATGAPMLPGGIVGGPYEGVDDDSPNSGNPVSVTFSGTLTGNAVIGVLIDDQTAAAPAGGRWVGCSVSMMAGMTAADVANAIALAFDGKNWPGWLASTVAGATVTFNPQAAGSATAYVVYGPTDQPGASGGVPGPIPAPVLPISVDESGDPNIVATFPEPVTGTADWGDGTTESFTNQASISHQYDNNGQYTLQVGAQGYQPSAAPVLVQGA